jgi:hypothetical protein
MIRNRPRPSSPERSPGSKRRPGPRPNRCEQRLVPDDRRDQCQDPRHSGVRLHLLRFLPAMRVTKQGKTIVDRSCLNLTGAGRPSRCRAPYCCFKASFPECLDQGSGLVEPWSIGSLLSGEEGGKLGSYRCPASDTQRRSNLAAYPQDDTASGLHKVMSSRCIPPRKVN